jgi:hypothetical protein
MDWDLRVISFGSHAVLARGVSIARGWIDSGGHRCRGCIDIEGHQIRLINGQAAVGGTGADSSIVAPPRDRRWNLNMRFGWLGSGGYRGIFHLGLDVCVKSRGH